MKGKKKYKNKNNAVESEAIVTDTPEEATVAEQTQPADDVVTQSQDTAAPQDSTSADEAATEAQHDNAETDTADSADTGDTDTADNTNDADGDDTQSDADTETVADDTQSASDTDTADDSSSADTDTVDNADTDTTDNANDADSDTADNADSGDTADTDTTNADTDTDTVEQPQDTEDTPQATDTTDGDSTVDNADTDNTADTDTADTNTDDDTANDVDDADTDDTDTADSTNQTDSVDNNNDADDAEQTADADNADPDAPTGAEEQPAKKKKKRTHLPYFGTVFDKDGQKIGKVRRDVCYDSDKQKVGKLVKEDDALYLVQDGQHKGYLDNNHNLFGTDNQYVATIRYKHTWLIAVLILVVLALIMISAVIAALYTTPSEDIIPTLFIADKQGNDWSETENLPIFFNEEFGDTVIAPGQCGSYAFKFENRNDVTLLFGLDFSCENEYGINLMYRLKRDGAYVAGNDDWVSIDDLDVHELHIQARSTALFELEWMWAHNDPVDTAAGENGAVYKLIIVLRAKAD